MPMMRFDLFVLAVLAVWRVTHLFHAEDGPFNLLARFRQRVGKNMLGDLLDCFYCLSLWMAAPFAYYLGTKPSEQLLLWLALSGGASLLERATGGTGEVTYFEEEE